MPGEANRVLLCVTPQSLYYAECLSTFLRGTVSKGHMSPQPSCRCGAASPGSAQGKLLDMDRHGDGTSGAEGAVPRPLPSSNSGSWAGSGPELTHPGSFPVTAVRATRWAPRRTSATPNLGSAPAARASRARPATDASWVSSASPSRAAGVRKPGPSWLPRGCGLGFLGKEAHGEGGCAAGKRGQTQVGLSSHADAQCVSRGCRGSGILWTGPCLTSLGLSFLACAVRLRGSSSDVGTRKPVGISVITFDL